MLYSSEHEFEKLKKDKKEINFIRQAWTEPSIIWQRRRMSFWHPSNQKQQP